MNPQGLFFAHVQDSGSNADRLAERLREWTLTWIRYKHSGPILEGPALEPLLNEARERGARYLFVLFSGDVITEFWQPDRAPTEDFSTALGRLLEAGDFLVAADGPPDAPGIARPPSLLVDLERHRRLGRALRLPDDVDRDFPEPIARGVLHVAPQSAAEAAALGSYLGDALAERSLGDERLREDQRRFLDMVKRQVENSPRGIFPLNYENYRDIEEPPEDHDGPLSTVLSVTAGFKGARLLETHGFDEQTRVVYFDYSAEALEFKRLLHEEWNGEDFPAFLRRTLEQIPPSRAFYQFWPGLDARDMDWDEMERAWEVETGRWGGADVLREHWRTTRGLEHHFLRCDLLRDHQVIYDLLDGRPAPAIWWSNAFFTFYSNWHLDLRARREIYGRFLRGLAERAPDLLLYGSDCHNVSVNCVRAGEYRAAFEEHHRSLGDSGILEPLRMHRHEMRF